MLLTYFTVILNNRLSPRDIGYVVNGQSLSSILDSWRRWDTGWYLLIAHQGYARPESVVFFPLYPALIHAGSAVFGSGSDYAVAWTIANLGTLATCIGLALLAVRESRVSSGILTVGILIAWPLAFFLFAPYTEGIFLAFVAWTLLGAREGWWRTAAICAFLGTLTRPTGVALFLPLAWEYGRQHGWWEFIWAQLRRKAGRMPSPSAAGVLEAAMVLGAVPLALALYLGYVKLHFGHASLVLSASHFWDRQSLPVWRTAWIALRHFVQTPAWSYWQAIELLDYGSVLVFGLVTLASIRRAPVAFTTFTLANIYLAVSQPIPGIPDVVPSASRYLLAALPVFIILGQLSGRQRWLRELLVIGGLLLQGALVTFYLSSGWVA